MKTTSTWGSVHDDVALDAPGESEGEGQAEASSLVVDRKRGRTPYPGLEDTRELLGAHAGSVVIDRVDNARVLAADGDVHRRCAVTASVLQHRLKHALGQVCVDTYSQPPIGSADADGHSPIGRETATRADDILGN